MAGGVALVASVAVAACGAEDFPNDPRPPAPIQLSALIKDRQVSLGPRSGVGAGLARITISNQTRDPVTLVLEGPRNNASDEIVPGGVGSMQVDLERGDYTVSAADEATAERRETTLRVGPERKSSQNELLLP
ncbi:MAG: hypothetical protein GEU88_02410 [Solirubrobacterales bacterium]|nr:hypothetical protein [Solirubrobacterales bacterium]